MSAKWRNKILVHIRFPIQNNRKIYVHIDGHMFTPCKKQLFFPRKNNRNVAWLYYLYNKNFVTSCQHVINDITFQSFYKIVLCLIYVMIFFTMSISLYDNLTVVEIFPFAAPFREIDSRGNREDLKGIIWWAVVQFIQSRHVNFTRVSRA